MKYLVNIQGNETYWNNFYNHVRKTSCTSYAEWLKLSYKGRIDKLNEKLIAHHGCFDIFGLGDWRLEFESELHFSLFVLKYS